MSQRSKPSEQVADRLRSLGKRVDTLPTDRGRFMFTPQVHAINVQIGAYIVARHAGTAFISHNLIAPCDYAELIAAYVVIAGVTTGAANFNLIATFGALNESYDANISTTLNFTPNLTAGIFYAADMLPALVNLQRGDFIGVTMQRLSGISLDEFGTVLYF